MPLPFFSTYGAAAVEGYTPPDRDDGYDDEQAEGVDVEAERPLAEWAPITPSAPSGWRPDDWPDHAPIRFIDGKDVGSTVSCVFAPGGGQPIPVRLSQIGSIAVTVHDRRFVRSFEAHETVVALVADPFPWHRVERLARDLADLDPAYRLLPARPPHGQLSYDFEVMRKAAQNRSGDAMAALEEAAVAHDPTTPTVVDGRLEPRSEGFDAAVHPTVAVIKTHRKRYLPAEGMRVLFALEAGQRTPYFVNGGERFKTVSWYLRLSGQASPILDQGVVRVEIALPRFQRLSHLSTPAGGHHADWLSVVLRRHRHRGGTYARAPISLHPIVRAEASLGACFSDHGLLASRFRRAAL